MVEKVKQEASIDMVLFFDANVPKMAACRSNCAVNDEIQCVHRFIFRVYFVERGSLSGLNDFEVVRRFIELIPDQERLQVPEPLFVLVTKDGDFIDDVNLVYRGLPTDVKNKMRLIFKPNPTQNNCEKSESLGSIACENFDPKLEIEVLKIAQKPYGSFREDNLRDIILRLNELWSRRLTP